MTISLTPSTDVCRFGCNASGTTCRGCVEGEATTPRQVTSDDIPERTWRLAEDLAEAVHHRMPVTVARLLDGADMPALCVALAALIDTSQTRAQQLAWAATPLLRSSPCGRPNYWASYKRHKYHGQDCAECHEGYKKERRVV